MALATIITNDGLSHSIIAQNERGFNVLVSSFGVSEEIGDLDASRTAPLTEWYTALISSGVRINSTTVEIQLSIPAGAVPTDKYVRELYLYGIDPNTMEEYLLAISQPNPEKLYSTSGTLIFRLQLQIRNLNIGDTYNFLYTQATEITAHNSDVNAHPPIREALAAFGCYIQESLRTWNGQTVDNFALPLYIGPDVADGNFVYYDDVASLYKSAINNGTAQKEVIGKYVAATNSVVSQGIVPFTHSLAPYTNIYLSTTVLGQASTAYSTKLLGFTLPGNRMMLNIIDIVKYGSIIGGGGGAGSFLPILGEVAPTEEVIGGMDLLGFKDTEQSMYFNFKIPEEYVGGNQLSLLGGVFYCRSAVTGYLLLKAQTTLLKKGASTLTESTNIHDSTNTEVLTPDVVDTQGVIGDIDLTDTDGLINGETVEAGDILKIKIFRDTVNVTSTLDDIVYIPRSCFEPKKMLV